MKLVSWNVNGLRACVNKGFMDYYRQSEADIFCLQETKLQAGQIEMDLGEDVYPYWNYAIKRVLRHGSIQPHQAIICVLRYGRGQRAGRPNDYTGV